MKLFRKIIAGALILCLLLTGGCAGATDWIKDRVLEKGESVLSGRDIGGGITISTAKEINRSATSESVTTEAGQSVRFSAEMLAPDGAHGDVSPRDMEYYHYDDTEFYRLLEEFLAAAEDGEDSRVTELYNRLYAEFLVVDSLDVLINLRYDSDVNDEELTEEMLFCDSLWAELSDALCSACHEVLTDSPAVGALASCLDADTVAYLRAYVPANDRLTELYDRESELVAEYYSRIDAADSAEYTYKGKTWTMDMLEGTEGDSLYYRDYDGYLQVWYGLMEAVNDQVGPLYLELVDVRAEIARESGYDNYIDYAYEAVYGRDYTAAEAQEFCELVKGDIAHAYYGDDIYYSDIWYEEIGTDISTGKMLSVLDEYTALMGEDIHAVWEHMSSLGLFDIGNGAGRLESCYTTEFSLLNEPVIFLYTYGDSYDFSSITHEFGHAVDAYLNPPENWLSVVGSYDLFEIHSTGMEMLFMPYYEEIFGDEAEAASFISLADLLACVVDGCIADEFQRRVYENPDMTLEEINRLYCDICAEYGQYEPYDVDYYWMYITHNFDSPLYYISYAASAVASLQLWQIGQTDPEEAYAIWHSVLEYGAYDEGYLTVLPACGLHPFTDGDAVEEPCEAALDYLENISRRYSAWYF